MSEKIEGSDETPLMVLYHNDWDGMVAAWSARKKLNGRAKYYHIDHGDPAPNMTGKIVYILDFCFPYGIMEDIQKAVKSLILLDHHKSAMENLEKLTNHNGIFFDMTKCGAQLSWEHFSAGKEIPKLVAYVSDMDRWEWSQPESRYVMAAIDMFPLTFDSCDELDTLLGTKKGFKCLVDQGNTVLRYQNRLIEEAIDHACPMTIDGHEVLVANVSTTSMVSETAARLAKGKPFGASFLYKKGKWIFSLRTDGDEIDVSVIARKYGGGGHRKSAGFISEVFPPEKKGE